MEEWKEDKGKTAKVREKAKQAIFETKHVAKNSTHNCLTERYHPRISTSSFDSCHLLIQAVLCLRGFLRLWETV